MESSKQYSPEAAQPAGEAPGQHRHHSHPGDTLEDAHTVVLEGDVEITVGEDEPSKHAVEAEISKIEEQDAGRPIKEYLDKWRGGIDTRVPVPSVRGVAVSWLGAFIGILVVSVTDHFLWRDHGFRLLVASFGASAVLLYGVPESKLSQPRNLIGERQQQPMLAASACSGGRPHLLADAMLFPVFLHHRTTMTVQCQCKGKWPSQHSLQHVTVQQGWSRGVRACPDIARECLSNPRHLVQGQINT